MCIVNQMMVNAIKKINKKLENKEQRRGWWDGFIVTGCKAFVRLCEMTWHMRRHMTCHTNNQDRSRQALRRVYYKVPTWWLAV